MINKQRTHGLSGSVNKYQLISWIVFAYSFIIFFMFIIPPLLYILAFSISSGIIYFVLTIAIVILSLIAMLTNPTDPRVTYENECKRMGIEPEDADDLIYFCDVCEAFVHERTKH